MSFIIASVSLHIIALSIWALVWKPNEMVTQPRLINLGVVGNDEGRVEGIGDTRETYQKVASKQEKKAVRTVNIKNQSIKITNKKEMASQETESVIEPSAISRSHNMSNEETNLISSDSGPGMGSFEAGKEVRGKGSMPGSQGYGQGIEVGYPDYKINPKPSYPTIARRNGYEGAVLLRVWVLESGMVGKIEIEKSSGYEMLDNSALKAVKGWIFIPGKRGGVPIPTWVTVPIKFQLRSG
jgi:TonB family protein